MKILRKWLLKWIQKAKEEYDRDSEKMHGQAIQSGNTIGGNYGSNYPVAKHDSDVPMRLNFNVMPASGGVVVSINKYDRQKGQHLETLHVIHDDDDVATNIGHIVSMELLRS